MTLLSPAISLEANIQREEIYDAYRGFPSLHGSPEVLRLLVAIQYNLDKSVPDIENACEAAYMEGEDEGYKTAIDNFFEPIDTAAHALIACVESDDPELKAEIGEAISDLKRELEKMEKEYLK